MADPDVDLTNLAIVRGGCCGGDAEVMQSPGGPDYNRIRDRLSTEGLSEQQVQVVWSQLSNNKPSLRHHLKRGAGSSPGRRADDGAQLKAQVPWLRVFVEGVVIVGKVEN